MLTRQCFALPDSFNLLCACLHTDKGLKEENAHGQGESEILVVFFTNMLPSHTGKDRKLQSVSQTHAMAQAGCLERFFPKALLWLSSCVYLPACL